MTVEELEIIITTNIEKALPNIRKVVKEVKKAVDETKSFSSSPVKNMNMDKIANEVSKATKQVTKETEKMKEQLKSLGLKDAGDVSSLKINNISREISGVSNKFKELKGQKGALADAFDLQRFKQQAREYKREVEDSIPMKKYDSNKIMSEISKDRNISIKADVKGTENAKNKLTSLKTYIDKISKYKFNVGNIEIDARKLAVQTEKAKRTIKSKIQGLFNNKTSGSKLDIGAGMSGAAKSATKMAGSLKMGLGQILRIAGALFSIRSIYGALSSLAKSWLSSQNEQAQQLNANIEYMKYAIGSTLAPVIEWIVNLIYQALKGVQSLIYALTGVNIFANASAKAYASMANNAKKASEAFSAGDIDEVHNIQENNSDSGNDSGTVAPNLDLGTVDTQLNGLFDKFKNGKWFEIGFDIGQKINETLEKIPWSTIKEKAGNIGTKLGEFINGGVAGTNWEKVGGTLAEGVNTVFAFLGKFLKTTNFEELGAAVSKTINSFFDTVEWDTVGQTISDGTSGALDFMKRSNRRF